MGELSEIKSNTPEGLLGFFRSTVADVSATLPSYYGKAARCWSNFLGQRSAAFPDAALLREWLLHMYAAGHSPKTSVLFLDALSAMCSAALRNGFEFDISCFKEVKAQYKSLASPDRGRVFADSLGRLRDVLPACVENCRQQPSADIVLTSLISGLTPIDAARLKKDGAVCPECAGIAARNASPRRQYIFDLGQSSLTAAQLGRSVGTRVMNFFRMNGLPVAATASLTTACYRASILTAAGYAPEMILGAHPGVDAEIPVLGLFAPEEPDDERKAEMAAMVNDFLAPARLRWYAMRLRPGASFADICARRGTATGFRFPELFYPLDEVARRTGRKIVHEERPVIREVVFFRSAPSAIAPLFRHIGDLAWCYRTAAGGAYAAITEESFMRFQRAIGHYAGGYGSADAAAVTPGMEELVTVEHGLFEGLEAELRSVETEDGASVWRLFYEGDNGIRWDVGVDPRQTTNFRP